jgi:hypothetical protein
MFPEHQTGHSCFVISVSQHMFSNIMVINQTLIMKVSYRELYRETLTFASCVEPVGGESEGDFRLW